MEALPPMGALWWGIVVSFLQILGTGAIGAVVLRAWNLWDGPYRFHLAFGIGASLQGTVLTVVSLVGAAYTWLLFVAWAGPALLALTLVFSSTNKGRRGFRGLLIDRNSPSDRSALLRASIWILAGIFFLYAAAYCFTAFRGADIAIYHLVVPRDIVWNHGFRPNEFFFAAGIPQGWHHYGVPAYLMGLESGYLGLSFWCLIGICLLFRSIVRTELPSLSSYTGDLAALAVAFVSTGLLQGSIPNNDLPATYLELILVVAVIRFGSPPVSGRSAYLVGILAGFILSAKLTSVVGVGLLVLAFVIARRDDRITSALRVGLTGAFGALAWPSISLATSGSPFPQALNSLRIFGDSLPHFAHSTAVMETVHGNWLVANADRLLTASMLPLPILIAGLLLLAIMRLANNLPRTAILLVGFAVLRFAGILALAPRLDILFHDRYHLVTYLILSVLGLVGWELSLRSVLVRSRPTLHFLPGAALIFLFLLSTLVPYRIRFPDAGPRGPAQLKMPNLFAQIRERLESVRRTPEWRKSEIISYVRTKTPPDAIIATMLMAPYDYQRRFMQILPVSQNTIDLTASPAAILAELTFRGATYLHLTPYPGLVPGIDPAIERWLNSVRAIPDLPGVHLVAEYQFAPGIYERLYKFRR